MGQLVGGVVGEGVGAPEVVGASEGMGQAVGGVVEEAQVLGGHEEQCGGLAVTLPHRVTPGLPHCPRVCPAPGPPPPPRPLLDPHLQAPTQP